MLKKYSIQHLIIVIVMAVSALFAVVVPMQVSAQEQTEATSSRSIVNSSVADNICKGVLSAQTGTISPSTTIDSCQENGDDSFSFLVRRIINLFSIVVGVVSVIMIIIGGFRYIISGGDSTGVQGAKNTILYAIVGLLIVLFAQVIVRFILTNAVQG